MAYHVYLDGEQLPVTPGRLRLTAKSRNLTLDLLEGGELNLPRAPGLWEAELQALLPQRWYPFANRGRRPIKRFSASHRSRGIPISKRLFTLLISFNNSCGI